MPSQSSLANFLMRSEPDNLLPHSRRSAIRLKKHKGKDFNREKRKMKRGGHRLGQIDTSVKSIKFED
ncbi:hypothetical protein NEHOM01_0440 [Nematocida homosporus]|uniref:uncharacterized protein n=1 Tax=Nematocida homosporus TaxID=1912981 RepID=UPI00221EC481|nr:uncharacterized protein NEHOM01_0440 [Nematocida homosporus]KAI5184889.1 hypothetical protein NEHOM01_0440 [Nematocida homosporus]